MLDITTGAAAGMIVDHAAEKSHLEIFGECLHSDIHDIKHAILSRDDKGVFYEPTTLQPGILVQLDIAKLRRKYSMVFVAETITLQFEISGLSLTNTFLTLQPGWNILNVPDGSRWGLPATAPQNISVLFAASDELFGNEASGAPATINDLLTQYPNFSALYGQTLGGGGGGNYALSLFNAAASSKNILIYSITVWVNYGTITGSVYSTSIDPALGTAPTIQNMDFGGPAQVASVSANSSTVSLPGSGLFLQVASAGEILSNGARILLPRGQAAGIEIFTAVANSTPYSIGVKWIEY